MTAADFKKAYNSHFFPNGKLDPEAEARLTAVLEFAGQRIELPGLQVRPQATIHEIAQTVANHIASMPPADPPAQEEAPPEAPPPPAQQELVAVEHIEYRKNTYIVQHLREDGQDRFIITNQASNKRIGEKTIVGRAVVKLYQK